MSVGVTLEVLDERGRVVACEKTLTENVSRRGAAVLTSFQLKEGARVRLTSAPQNSYLAVVRAYRIGADGRARLHLEFLEREWKIEGV